MLKTVIVVARTFARSRSETWTTSFKPQKSTVTSFHWRSRLCLMQHFQDTSSRCPMPKIFNLALSALALMSAAQIMGKNIAGGPSHVVF